MNFMKGTYIHILEKNALISYIHKEIELQRFLHKKCFIWANSFVTTPGTTFFTLGNQPWGTEELFNLGPVPFASGYEMHQELVQGMNGAVCIRDWYEI